MDNKYYPVFEVALKLHISESTLYLWIHKKKISHIKIGSRVLFSQENIDEFINNNTVNIE